MTQPYHHTWKPLRPPYRLPEQQYALATLIAATHTVSTDFTSTGCDALEAAVDILNSHPEDLVLAHSSEIGTTFDLSAL